MSVSKRIHLHNKNRLFHTIGIVFCCFVFYINYLCIVFNNVIIMNKEFLKKKMDNWQRLYDAFYDQPFDTLKKEIQRIESDIRNIVGEDPDWLNFDEIRRNQEELELLLDQRRTLLNWMFRETPEEVERMKVVNSRFFDLTKRLRLKMADVCKSLVEHIRDDFDDDYEVDGMLSFSYEGEDSVLSYEGDPAYGSNFPLMISLNNHMRFLSNRPYLELSCRYNDSRKSILSSGNCDIDNLSWAHEIAGAFDGIYICHTTAVFCRDFGYPVVDVLHMNDFWNEVHVRYQQFATQDPNYEYPRVEVE